MDHLDRRIQDDLEMFAKYEELPEERLYTEKEVLLRLARYKKANMYRSWASIAREMETNYQAFISFKNLNKEVSQNYLQEINKFLESQGY